MNTVLVVDDTPYIVEVFSEMLKRGGYQAITARSGQECLDTLKAKKPDVVLLDIMMQPMDGWETLERIKNTPDLTDLPVLMLTAKQPNYGEAQKYGMYIEDYVLKPISHRELYTAIEQVLQRRGSIQKAIEAAKEAGFSHRTIDEYSRLFQNIEVSKRLLHLLETTHNSHGSRNKEVTEEINNMKNQIKYQEERLRQIRQEIDDFLKKKKK